MGGSCDKKGRRKNNNIEMCVDEIQLAERTARRRQKMGRKDQVEMDMRKLMEAICIHWLKFCS